MTLITIASINPPSWLFICINTLVPQPHSPIFLVNKNEPVGSVIVECESQRWAMSFHRAGESF